VTTAEHEPNRPCRSTGESCDSDTPTASPSRLHGSENTSPMSAESHSSSPMPMERSPSSPSYVPSSQERFQLVRISQLDLPDDMNGRLAVDSEAADELAADLRENGLLHPITVTRNGARFTLIAGRRRIAAALKCGWTSIYATVLLADERKQAELRFLENATRSDLSPVEEAKQLAAMLELTEGGIDAIAKRINRRPEWIQDRLEMCDWPDELLQAVHVKALSLGAAQRLARIQPDELRASRIEFARLHGINVRTAQLWLSESQTRAPDETEMSLSLTYQHNEHVTSETRFHCLMCQGAFPLENTVPMRVCGDCLQVISSSHNQIDNEQTQPPAFESSAERQERLYRPPQPISPTPPETFACTEPAIPQPLNQHHPDPNARHPQ